MPTTLSPIDKTCNGLCHVTHRPLSAGRPDGVWVISILYAVCVMAALLIAGGRTLSALPAAGAAASEGGPVAALWLQMAVIWIPAMAVAGLCLPPIVLLFRRKVFVVAWEYFLLMVCIAMAGVLAVGLIRTRSLGYLELAGLLLPILAHVYAVAYTIGLREDGFLVRTRSSRCEAAHP